MVNRDAAPQTQNIPVVKRKRRASCLGEQERRERKRAIDREAQRSLREKTKTHIADLERTIQILRDQDRNGATANLLSEVEGLRCENERLRDVIESVKGVVGTAPATSAHKNGGGGSPTAASVGPEHGAYNAVGERSPKPRATSFNKTNPSFPTPTMLPNAFDFHEHEESPTMRLDLDGMTVMTDVNAKPTVESPSVEELTWSNDPATATWVPLMAEVFGPEWRIPSPFVLHIGSPDPPVSTRSNTVCPVWRKTNQLFGKVFSYRPATDYTIPALLKSDHAEASLLYLGIKQGWGTLPNDWKQSPALTILREVDDLLFCHLPNIARLAFAYKSFKLLKYYLEGSKEQLDKVPDWLRPSLSQSSTKHPVAIDFFAWPTFRDRLIRNHDSIFQTSELYRHYSKCVSFDWPFSYEDTFFHDELTGNHYPSPLFERYHGDLKSWTVDPKFKDRFPEMLGDIEGDRRRFSAVYVD
ncbi:uncharacterized protein K460DRAFT_318140 [Cucurbitaria berberidis CBS 394.84]|uniref:BZIP domain-containing protein n=1 Tax=Cucurbitaria berberidis CBS 394.84 TaxID=1168544 RepID=A0A9P4L4H5_9PLEO|nr:uncharacterized protein K460DRAFT_318140 [Cucurbitaria berberidis CBS 394.84]KAF1841324.1 hypothetical protein K460DRAFT_318140 [Cucurbitaria berberidis CBS 394.84]